jgi:hypothetical protein
VRHESWQVWRRLEDIGALSENGRQKTIDDLASLSSSLDLKARSTLSEPPPPPSGQELRASMAPVAPFARSSLRPAAVDPVGVLANAKELGQALLLALSTAATAASADLGVVFRNRRDLSALVAFGGYGPSTERLLGERISPEDPTLSAAAAGHSVVSEPEFGENSRYVLGRLGRCVAGVRGVAMVPLLLYGDLIAIFELGNLSRPFRAREIARAEDVIETLAGRCVVMGWL